MTDALTWGAVILAGGSIIAVIRFWTEQGRFQERADAAVASAAAMAAKYEMMVREIADYRVAIEVKIAVVKTLVETNTTALSSAEVRLAKAMEDVRDQLGHLNDRIDKFLDK